MITGNITTQKFDGIEISPKITLIGEPTPIAGTNKMRCLANVEGMLALVELKVTFGKTNEEI